MEKIKTIISAIITFIITLLFPARKILLQSLKDINSLQEITFQTHLYQLLIIYGFVFIVSFIGIYHLLKSIFPNLKP